MPSAVAVSPGAVLPGFEKTFSTVDLMAYGAATWDWHRLHYDQAHARARGLPDVIIDGQMFGALFAKQAMDWAGPRGFVARMGIRMRSMAFAGDTLRCEGAVEAVGDERDSVVATLSQRLTSGARVIAECTTEVRLPGAPDRRSAVTVLYYDDFEVGDTFPTYGRTVTEGEIAQFCGFVGYHVPLFIDEEYARATDYGGRIAPSALIMSVSTGMTESLFRYNMVGLIAVERGRFYVPLRAGDTIRTEVAVVDKKLSRKPDRGVVTFRDQVYNQRDELIFEIDKVALIKRQAVGEPDSS